MENKNYFCTYAFYNRKGQRLSIFGTAKAGIDTNGTTCGLSLYIIKHSKTPDAETGLIDRFSKKWVRRQFEDGNFAGTFSATGIKPTIINLPCTPGDSKRVFMEYCNQNFYKMEVAQLFGTNVGIQFETLIKRSFNGEQPQVIILPSTVHTIKSLGLSIEIQVEDTVDPLNEVGDTIPIEFISPEDFEALTNPED